MALTLIAICLILFVTLGGFVGAFRSAYVIESSFTASDHSYYTASLKYTGQDSYYINRTNPVIQNLNFTYFFTSPEHLVVRITDKDKERWEVPNNHPFPHKDYTKKFAPMQDALVTVTVTDSPFSFKLTRTKTGEVIFDSSVGEFIYSDYYLQISTSLATPNVYGLGERAYKLNLGPDGTYSIFNKDLPFKMEDGTPGNNLYGYHPVYLMREKSNFFSSALLRSSVPMDVQFEGGKKLTYKVIGGVMDFQFFLGTKDSATPETVLKQYHTYLGGWVLQPFWSFGFHQCRWGYKNTRMLEDVLEGYNRTGLPLDVIWSDIDYMDRKIDFTIDSWAFPDDRMNNMLQKHNKRWVPIIDAGVATNNDISRIGLKNQVFVRDPDGSFLRGSVWPGDVNFPDFLNPNTSLFWDIGLNILHKKVPYSGIWLDMNEVSNFVPGEVGFRNDETNILNNPPYKPAKAGDQIYTMTIRMDAVHHGGVKEYYVHNMFGFLESKATHNYLKTLSDLTFILTRSSFYGSGKYAAHWTGDNSATYEFLQVSIPTVISSGIFGMPMAGADICGFERHTTEELCSRWMQLGTLYPFSRNHNKDDAMPQEPYALGATVLQTSRVTLAFRYSIVRHYYTEFLKQKGTGTIFRPLFFEYPEDQTLYRPELKITDNQFFIGDSLMVAPALEKGQTIVSAYFPKDTWFDFVTGKLIKSGRKEASIVQRPAPFNATAPIFIRGGHIIATQDTTGVTRTDDLSNIYHLNIAFKYDKNRNEQTSQGALAGIASYEDGNILTKCRMNNCLYSINADISLQEYSYKTSVTFTPQGDANLLETIKVSHLTLMGDFGGNGRYFSTEFKSNVAGTVKIEVAGNVIKYTFAQPFEVKPNAKIEISGTRSSHKLRFHSGTDTIDQ